MGRLASSFERDRAMRIYGPQTSPKELTDADVLRVDPVHEYERREILREISASRFEQVQDEADELVARGRPTGP
jgi:hypothetical protein